MNSSLKHINIPFYHKTHYYEIKIQIVDTFDKTAVAPISLFQICGDYSRYYCVYLLYTYSRYEGTGAQSAMTGKGHCTVFLVASKIRKWELWSKPNKTWTHNKCCMAKANALLLVGWLRHKWGRRRILLQSTKPINQSLQVWFPILAEASNQQSPYIQFCQV